MMKKDNIKRTLKRQKLERKESFKNQNVFLSLSAQAIFDPGTSLVSISRSKILHTQCQGTCWNTTFSFQVFECTLLYLIRRYLHGGRAWMIWHLQRVLVSLPFSASRQPHGHISPSATRERSYYTGGSCSHQTLILL